MIDAAVSGSVPQVEQGSLVIFVGGEQETYQQCKPILDILGQSSFYMGPSGMGTTMKLVVNTLLGLGMQALAEAIALGEKAGLAERLAPRRAGTDDRAHGRSEVQAGKCQARGVSHATLPSRSCTKILVWC